MLKIASHNVKINSLRKSKNKNNLKNKALYIPFIALSLLTATSTKSCTKIKPNNSKIDYIEYGDNSNNNKDSTNIIIDSTVNEHDHYITI